MATEDDSQTQLSLEDFIIEARDRNREIVSANRDSSRFLTSTWHFIRFLKGHPVFAELNGDDAIDTVRDALNNRCPSGDPWIEVLGFTETDEVDFLTSWHKPNSSSGSESLRKAVNLALTGKLNPRRCDGGRLPGYRYFVSVAGYLQIFEGNDRNILLPCEKLGDLFGVDKSTISRYRQLAVMDGYLTIVKEHRRPRGGDGAATEFRFSVDQLHELEKIGESFRGRVENDGEDW